MDSPIPEQLADGSTPTHTHTPHLSPSQNPPQTLKPSNSGNELRAPRYFTEAEDGVLKLFAILYKRDGRVNWDQVQQKIADLVDNETIFYRNTESVCHLNELLIFSTHTYIVAKSLETL